jgi:hypothetical protein
LARSSITLFATSKKSRDRKKSKKNSGKKSTEIATIDSTVSLPTTTTAAATATATRASQSKGEGRGGGRGRGKDTGGIGIENLSDEEQRAKVQALIEKRFNKGMGEEMTTEGFGSAANKNKSKKRGSSRLDQKMNASPFGASPLGTGSTNPASPSAPPGKKKNIGEKC